jgi:copper chaperone
MHRFKVEGMSCAHCVAAVTREIQAVDPAAAVKVDLTAGRVEVESGLTSAQIVALIEEAGYAARVAESD